MGRIGAGGITKLSELDIDAILNMAGLKIENLGAPDSSDDAKRDDSAPAAHNQAAGTITSGRFPTTRLEWTLNKLLKGAGAGSDPTEIDVPAAIATIVGVSDDLLGLEADTERSVQGTTYVKIKEIRVDMAGAIRVKFDLKADVGVADGRIYRNGGAVGTEQSQGTSYATKSDDIAGWSIGDLLQLYIKHTDGGSNYGFGKNLKLYGGMGAGEVVTD